MHTGPSNSSGSRVVMRAPAKINLYLGVGALRSDGYHDVDTILHTIALADTVILERVPGVELRSETDLGIPAEENLALRAARALGARVGHELDVRITLDKRIPAGAGLGGASSDAAAVLVGLPMLWGIDVDAALLAEIAAGLGADVPFFLSGATALYGERGERHVRDISTPSLQLVLLKCAQPVPTARAYETFDLLGSPPLPGPNAMIAACESGDAARIAGALFNNMVDAAVDVVPEIAAVLEFSSAEQGVMGCTLSGSGSAVFAVCESASAAGRAALSAGERGYWAYATCSDGAGVRRVGEGSS